MGKRKRQAQPGHRPPKTIWVLFDHANGLDGAKNYVFWFETRAKARSYKKEMDKRCAKSKYGSCAGHTTGPFRYAGGTGGAAKMPGYHLEHQRRIGGAVPF